jgi:hypothetical protein
MLFGEILAVYYEQSYDTNCTLCINTELCNVKNRWYTEQQLCFKGQISHIYMFLAQRWTHVCKERTYKWITWSVYDTSASTEEDLVITMTKLGHNINWKTFCVEAVIYSYHRSSTYRMFNISISYTEGPVFMSQPENRFIRLRFLVVFPFLPVKHQFSTLIKSWTLPSTSLSIHYSLKYCHPTTCNLNWQWSLKHKQIIKIIIAVILL